VRPPFAPSAIVILTALTTVACAPDAKPISSIPPGDAACLVGRTGICCRDPNPECPGYVPPPPPPDLTNPGSCYNWSDGTCRPVPEDASADAEPGDLWADAITDRGDAVTDALADRDGFSDASLGGHSDAADAD
jgi:hypothetical protein